MLVRILGWSWRILGTGLLILWLGLVGGVSRARADVPPTEKRPDGSPWYDLRVVRDLEYRKLEAGEDAALGKNRLDLYLPRGATNYPVILFIHGGAWIHGDKNYFGIYSSWAMYWAHRGVGVAIANYRLSPGVKHPAHVQDIAKAVAWLRNQIAGYGGDPDQLFLAGHSAGGHLIALLATDPKYLQAEHVPLQAIRGVIPISGVYRVHGFQQMAGILLGDSDRAVAAGVRLRSLPFHFIFGEDAQVRQQASPIEHLHPGLPPFLVIVAGKDLPLLPEMAREFDAGLRAQHCESTLLEVKKRTHMSVLLNASRDDDPVAVAMTEFLNRHSRKPASP